MCNKKQIYVNETWQKYLYSGFYFVLVVNSGIWGWDRPRDEEKQAQPNDELLGVKMKIEKNEGVRQKMEEKEKAWEKGEDRSS